jgi:hypothetical protein
MSTEASDNVKGDPWLGTTKIKDDGVDVNECTANGGKCAHLSCTEKFKQLLDVGSVQINGRTRGSKFKLGFRRPRDRSPLVEENHFARKCIG